ncbi:hypothetical protein GGR58DRAFT_331210 [Xylaria digitata]|nr:hypothetical protein GGR58DRAFT_331210 [Xylaria digitata]
MVRPRTCWRCRSRKSGSCFACCASPPCFPFSRLPLELRLEVFEFYALPKERLVYGDKDNRWGMISLTTASYTEFWSLLRVNREARQAVLRGRQAIFDESVKPGRPGRLNFIDWGRDLFVRTGHDYKGYGRTDLAIERPVFVSNIQHLAFSCHYIQESLDKPGKISTKFPGVQFVNMSALRCFYLITHDNSFKSYPTKRGRYYNDNAFGFYDDYPLFMGDPYYVPTSVETVLPYAPGSLDGPTSLAWCQDFLRCLIRYRDEMEEFVLCLCGQTIKCKTLILA